METFGIKEVIEFVIFGVGIVTTFLTTKHKLKEYVRDELDKQREVINQLKVQHKEEISRLQVQHKEEIGRLQVQLKDVEAQVMLQKQVVEQIGKQLEHLIPELLEALKRKQK